MQKRLESLSVVIPNYNHGTYLPGLLDRILADRSVPGEIIIIDDASTDNSVEIVKKYQSNNTSIHLYKNQKNLGPIATFNEGFQLASGEFISACSADDLPFAGFYAECVNLLEKDTQLGMCFGNPCFFKNEKPYDFECISLYKAESALVLKPNEIVSLLKNSRFWLPSHSAIYRKKAMVHAGFYKEELGILCDWFMNIKIAFHFGIGYIPKSFAALRVLDNSFCHKTLRQKDLRKKVALALMKEIENEKNHQFAQAIKESRILSRLHPKMLLDLLFIPKHFPDVFFPILKKIKDYSYQKLLGK